MDEYISFDRRYAVSVFAPTGLDGTLVFSFSPKGVMSQRGTGDVPTRVPKFLLTATRTPSGIVFDWSGTHDDPGADRVEMEAEAINRFNGRNDWINRVSALTQQVEQWAKQLGWATRRLAKQIDDSWIGKTEVPALLMQEDICRVMLEPVARSIPGTEGVVDLYLMPAYDDIARLYYHGEGWKLQRPGIAGDFSVEAADELEAVPLSKLEFERLLSELTRHAA